MVQDSLLIIFELHCISLRILIRKVQNLCLIFLWKCSLLPCVKHYSVCCPKDLIVSSKQSSMLKKTTTCASFHIDQASVMCHDTLQPAPGSILLQ